MNFTDSIIGDFHQWSFRDYSPIMLKDSLHLQCWSNKDHIMLVATCFRRNSLQFSCRKCMFILILGHLLCFQASTEKLPFFLWRYCSKCWFGVFLARHSQNNHLVTAGDPVFSPFCSFFSYPFLQRAFSGRQAHSFRKIWSWFLPLEKRAEWETFQERFSAVFK